MNDRLTSQIFRTLILQALSQAPPDLLKEILSESPNEDRIVSGLRDWNDKHHATLKDGLDFRDSVERMSKSRSKGQGR